ncbi:hypothetical protein RJT34_08820 [Clitoria ternatea]|uniref:Uncharacterized protein n=1 Tax=Clitoria ternatea TaxID=43366 RepID=A0AAN9PUB4_CLITE
MLKMSESHFTFLKYLLSVYIHDDCHGLFPCSEKYVLGSVKKSSIVRTVLILFKSLIIESQYYSEGFIELYVIFYFCQKNDSFSQCHRRMNSFLSPI